MSYYRIIIFIAIATIAFGSARYCLAGAKPPEVFVETGICPGEYCRYGLHYIANKDVETYNKPNEIITGSIKKGTKVQSVTGDVYSVPLQVKRVPQRGKIFKNQKWIEAPELDMYANEKLDIDYGEKFYVIRYEAEGYWKAWFKGEIVSLPGIWDLSKLGVPKSTWWVQLKTESGIMNWVKAQPYVNFHEAFKCVDPNCGVWKIEGEP